MSSPAPSPARFALAAAGALGLTGVALGAMGAHALAAPLAERGLAHAWDTGSRYHLFHAITILVLGIWLQAGAGRSAPAVHWAVRLWIAGVLLFSGSLYGLALGGPRWLGPVTPFGGLALMAGWVMVGIAAFRTGPDLRPRS